ncbi:MAG: bifunctional folylpolyglutamate synthase/dihydrofolate synthase, partial [Bryobacterales bacterium]|nr:bifunctional folylpolyglutamate synthase/dihydrofolate synthase [Bryobacterales bacterium]
GTMRDKSIAEIADVLFPLAQELILTAPDSPRSLDPRSLLKICGHPKARVVPRLAEALPLVRSEAAPEDAVFVSGSLFLVGEARALLVQ